MNCQDFRSIVAELPGGKVDPEEAASGRAHAAICAPCGTLLSEQQELTQVLQALASETAHEQAPPQVEAVLRQNFRDRRVEAANPPAAPAPDSAQVPPRTWRDQILGGRLAWAIAAVVVVSAAIAIAERLPVKPNHLPATPSTNRTPLAPSNSAPIAALSHTEEAPVQKAPVAPPTLRPPRPLRTAGPPGHHPRPQRFVAQKPASRTTPSAKAPRKVVMSAFYPLPYGSGLGLDEGWELVRVQVPVSALAAIGVRLADESASTEFVKADVVLSQDGTARAIRFVQ